VANISKPTKRVDAPAKIRGEAKYVADIHFDNLLYAKTIRSSYAKAKILSITLPQLPSGYFIIDKNDVPGKNRMHTVTPDHPIFAEDDVNYIGQPILLVVGPSRERVYDLASQIQIDYQPENPVGTIEEAEKQDNIFTDYHYEKGNPEEAFKNAELKIEDEYRSGRQEHVYLEPQSIIAEYKDEQIFVYGSMQCPFYIVDALQDALGWDKDRIRVVQAVTGGAFGGKEEFPSLPACQVAIAALKTNHPVQIIYDRNEDIISSTKRHPSIIHYKAGLDKEGHIIALYIDIKFDAGAYSGLSPVVLQRGMFTATGVYNFHNLYVRGRNYKTNNVPSGAFRGFGAPQNIFAIEMVMHNMAIKLGVDPLDFKMKHILKKGDSTATGGSLHDEVKLPEIIQKIVEMSQYRVKYENCKKYQGIGISLFLHGCGFTGKGEADIKGKVILKKKDDSVIIKVSNVEMGQGAETCLRKIVAYSLNLPIEKVFYQPVDTGVVPDSGPTVASRTIMIVGGLLHQACYELKERWHEGKEIEISKIYKHPDFLKWNNDKFEGDAYPTYSWGANVAEIEVDPITYEINIKKIYGVYDVGAPIDQRTLLGQVHGGILQGIGYATTEVMNSSAGKLLQANLTDYKIPTAQDAPEIECAFIENPYEFGPFGAKCAGELPFVGVAPAIAAAVSKALSVKIQRIPLNPEFIYKLMHNED
jgi:CO/xanthine dehydrogenase Mo-binding subunit